MSTQWDFRVSKEKIPVVPVQLEFVVSLEIRVIETRTLRYTHNSCYVRLNSD